MADPTRITPEDAKAIAKYLAEALKGSGGSTYPTTSPSSHPFKDQMDKATESLNPFKIGIGLVGDAASKAASTFNTIKGIVEPNLETFRDLSKSGINFSGDIVGMSVAMKGMRLTQDEFSEVMKNNSSRFIALGGNATRGAEAFAKLSEEFMSSEYIDQLTQAGFKHKELNEILAMQTFTRRGNEKEDAASRKTAIESAARLALEMDLQAKLTGRSREEQMATMKKAREDMAIEAKMRQLAAEKGISVEEQRQQYQKALNEATAAGVETSFRETVLYGQARSKEAAMEQFGAGQEAFKSSLAAGRKFVEGDTKETSELLKKATVETVEYQRTAAAQSIAMLPNTNNPVVQATHKVMKQTLGSFDGLDAMAQRADMRDKSAAEQQKAREEDAKKAQAGINEYNQSLGGVTKTIINFDNRVKDYEAALYKNVGTFLNEKLAPEFEKFSNRKLGGEVTDPYGKPSTVSKELDKVFQTGLRGPTPEQDAKRQELENRYPNIGFGDKILRDKSEVFGGDVIEGAASGIRDGANLIVNGLKIINEQSKKDKPSMYGGTPGFFNEIVHDFGTETEALLHGKKAVLNEKQLLDMAKGINTNAFSESLGALKNVTVSGKGGMPMEMPNLSAVSQMSESLFQSMPKNMMAPLQNMDMENQFRNMANKFKEPDVQKSLQIGQSSMNDMLKDDKIVKSAMSETKSTLDDVVGSLNSLNTKIERLLDTQLDLGTRQIKATKSNNNNIYSRA